MLDIEEIENTIEELENERTTFENCLKLASLYIIRGEHSKPVYDVGNDVQRELNDILPQYKKYVEVKRRYQLGEVTEKAVENMIKNVCIEISEFIHTLYTGTDLPIERFCIKNMLENLMDL